MICKKAPCTHNLGYKNFLVIKIAKVSEEKKLRYDFIFLNNFRKCLNKTKLSFL